MLCVPCQGLYRLESMWWQVSRDELLDEDDYEDLLDDIACEVEAKFGALASWAPQVGPCPGCFWTGYALCRAIAYPVERVCLRDS